MHNNEKTVYFRRIGGFLSDFLVILFWFTTILAFSGWEVFVPLVMATVIHECGHACMMACFDGRARMPRVGIFRFLFPGKSGRGYVQEGMIYLGGALFNLVFCALAVPFIFIYRACASAFMAANMMTAITNLLPMRGSDGYGAVRVVLDYTGASRAWYTGLRWVSFAVMTAGALLESLPLALEISFSVA